MHSFTRRVLVLGCIWLALFVLITVLSFEKGEIGYTNGEWFRDWGYPTWLTLGGASGGLRDLQRSLTSGEWSCRVPSLAYAMAVAFAPLAIFLAAASLLRGRFHWRPLTAFFTVLVAAAVIWLNLRGDQRMGPSRYGWPLNLESYSRHYEGIVTDAGVAIVLVFFAAVVCELCHRGLCIKCEGIKYAEGREPVDRG
jgi:uncharacterized membrane protein YhaH (DUF805 family)